MSDDGEKVSKSFSGQTSNRWNQFYQSGNGIGSGQQHIQGIYYRYRKKYSSLNKEHDIFKRYSEVYDKEHLYERLKRTKEENMELKNENSRLKTKIMQLEKSYQRLISDQYGKQESKLIIDSLNLQKEIEEKNQEISDLKRKDKINKCQELEIEVAKYLDECKRLREIIINQSEENTKLKDAINQFYGVQKQMSQVQNGNKHLIQKCDNYKKKYNEEQDNNKKYKEQIEKSEIEIDRLKMQIHMMKQHQQAMINSSSRQEQNRNEISSDEKYIYEKEKLMMTRIIEKQKLEIKKLKNTLREEKLQSINKNDNQEILYQVPNDIKMIIYSIKQAMVKNLFCIRQLSSVFENEIDPLEENMNKQQMKCKLKKWPFQLNNESHLIRFVEWFNKEQQHISRKEFIKKFLQLLLPYPNNASNQEDIELVNLYLRNNEENIQQQSNNGFIGIIALMDVVQEIMPQQYSNLFQFYILDQSIQLDKIPLSAIFQPIRINKMRSKSSQDQKRLLKPSPMNSLKYRPDYHFRRYGNTQQLSPVNFMDFYK